MVYETITISDPFLDGNCLLYDNGIVTPISCEEKKPFLCLYKTSKNITKLTSSSNLSIIVTGGDNNYYASIKNKNNAYNNKIFCYSGTPTYPYRNVYNINEASKVNISVVRDTYSFTWCNGLDQFAKSYMKSNVLYTGYMNKLDYALSIEMQGNPFETNKLIDDLRIYYCLKYFKDCTVRPINIINVIETNVTVLFHINLPFYFANVEDEIKWMKTCHLSNSTFKCNFLRKINTCLGETVGMFLFYII